MIAILLLLVPLISNALLSLNAVVSVLQGVTDRAARYMFGYVAVGPGPFNIVNPDNSFIIAFQLLPPPYSSALLKHRW